ncbi:MAG: hydroxymethylbilane synthase [Planctomycetota bacterium]
MIRIATRASALALAQSSAVASALQRLGETTELVIRTTTGDAMVHEPFTSIDGKGFFTKELEDALLANEADLAVHSLKDLPTELPPGLRLAATPEREDPADLLIIRNEFVDWRFALPVAPNANVGTSSARRRAQWAARRPDTQLLELRGNVPTRIDKLRAGEYGAILLAKAGINRLALDLSEFTTIRLDPTVFIPAPGQGALGLEIREGDEELAAKLALLNRTDVRGAVDAERAVLLALGGGCSQPVGVYARRRGRSVVLDAVLGPGASGLTKAGEIRRARVVTDTYANATKRAIETLNYRHSAARVSLRSKTVIITQQKGRCDRIACDLEERGARVLLAPLITIQNCADDAARAALAGASKYHYILFTSRTAADAFVEIAGPSVLEHLRSAPEIVLGAVGRTSAEPLEAAGLAVEIVSRSDGAASLAGLVIRHAEGRGLLNSQVLFPCAKEPRAELCTILQNAGMDVTRAPLYETKSATAESLAPLRGETADYALFFSPSAVATYQLIKPFETRTSVAIGPTTLTSIVEGSLPDPRLAGAPDPGALLEIIK